MGGWVSEAATCVTNDALASVSLFILLTITFLNLDFLGQILQRIEVSCEVSVTSRYEIDLT